MQVLAMSASALYECKYSLRMQVLAMSVSARYECKYSYLLRDRALVFSTCASGLYCVFSLTSTSGHDCEY